MSNYQQPAAPQQTPGHTTYQPNQYAQQQHPGQSLAIPGHIPAYLAQNSQQVPSKPAPPPTLPGVTPAVAGKAVDRLVSYELKAAGFNSAEPLALQRLEVEVGAFIEQLFQRVHEYATLANRSGPIATDLISACAELDLHPKDLRRVCARTARRQKRGHTALAPLNLLPLRSESPPPETLNSDEEETPAVPQTLRALPPYFPSLPPKHTYLRTPALPPKKAALPSLEKKLKTAGLVQESLRNLMLATEDTSGQEDAELLGHIVNWETGVHPRKRWKVGAK
ncbi:hypothetical protein HGRIS_009597 [Hohenbuehelia grisea]|uniref:Transcription initiation factor TFIID subunit 8 n=1 Tax=Hohenbuehelia grisea TaxID=104357 RepID=A0ABR3J1S8_9AGAR